MKNELTEELTKQAHQGLAVQQQNLYGSLINWRSSKLDDVEHKEKVLKGYYKLMAFFNRGK